MDAIGIPRWTFKKLENLNGAVTSYNIELLNTEKLGQLWTPIANIRAPAKGGIPGAEATKVKKASDAWVCSAVAMQTALIGQTNLRVGIYSSEFLRPSSSFLQHTSLDKETKPDVSIQIKEYTTLI